MMSGSGSTIFCIGSLTLTPTPTLTPTLTPTPTPTLTLTLTLTLTIFCIGSPRADARDTWQQELRAEYADVGVTIFERAFCSRPEDAKLW